MNRSEAKVFFMGSDPIALPLLDWLQGVPAVDLCAIFTQPDRRRGRGKHLQANAIKSWALEHGVSVHQPDPPGRETIAWMEEEGPRFGLVMAYGHLLRESLLEAPANGLWNFHGSLLPRLRGASPLETAIAEGHAESGVCLMRVVKKMDAGPVADVEAFPIRETDRAVAIRERAAEACIPLLARNLDRLLGGGPEVKPQDEGAATYCRKLSKEDGFFDFGQPAAVLERRFRACFPWPGSGFTYADQTFKVGEARALPDHRSEDPPGFLRVEGGRIRISTSSGILEIGALQRPGGKMMKAEDFLRGFPLETGTDLPFSPSKAWEQGSPFLHKP